MAFNPIAGGAKAAGLKALAGRAKKPATPGGGAFSSIAQKIKPPTSAKPPMAPKPPAAAKPAKPRMPSTPGLGIGVGGTPPGIAKLGAKPGSSAPKMPGVSTPPVSGISAPRTRAPRMGRGKGMI